MTITPKLSLEAELHGDLARIRQEHPFSGNYREQLAALLGVMFFKYGERVGANRLVALLTANGRGPSTSTAQDEINLFWGRMRQQAVFKLNRPDVPDFLAETFSDMVAAVWQKSMLAAEASFSELKEEVADQRRELEHEWSKLSAQHQHAQAELADNSATIASQANDLAQLRSALHAAVTRETLLCKDIQASQIQVKDLQQQLVDSKELIHTLDTRHAEALRQNMQTLDDYKQQALRARNSWEATLVSLQKAKEFNEEVGLNLKESELQRNQLQLELEVLKVQAAAQSLTLNKPLRPVVRGRLRDPASKPSRQRPR